MIVVADTGPIITLGHSGHIYLVEAIFGQFYIPRAVFEELKAYSSPGFDKQVVDKLKANVKAISSRNHLEIVMDYGESEAVILYEELGADFLLIDDQKARAIAESFGVICVGSLGLLIKAKQKGLITELMPVFQSWIDSKRFFAKDLLNSILINNKEFPLK